MNIEELRSYVIEQIMMYEQIVNADRRLSVCRKAQGRLEALRDILKKIEEGETI